MTPFLLQLADLADGSLDARYEYDPFGNSIIAEDLNSDANSLRMNSKYYDTETGVYCFPLRYYSPTQGRWLNRDPIAEYGGNNIYKFSENAPTSYFDALGLLTTPAKKLLMELG